MIEAGVVIGTSSGKADSPIYWHTPIGRSAGHLPDSQTLWDAIWNAYELDILQGFAHSHPGSGVPGPSGTDLSTFAAVEAALGKRLDWWITSSDHVVLLRWSTGSQIYESTLVESPLWAKTLMEYSYPQHGWEVATFDQDSLWGTVENANKISHMFHSTMFSSDTSQRWPVIGESVEISFYDTGKILAVRGK
jgi:hypothetical protein